MEKKTEIIFRYMLIFIIKTINGPVELYTRNVKVFPCFPIIYFPYHRFVVYWCLLFCSVQVVNLGLAMTCHLVCHGLF